MKNVLKNYNQVEKQFELSCSCSVKTKEKKMCNALSFHPFLTSCDPTQSYEKQDNLFSAVGCFL